MKLPFIGATAGAGLLLGLALCGSVMAAESTDAEATSGAADSTLMTQSQSTTQNAKVVKNQKAEVNKGGRPLNNSSSTTSQKPAN
jgi:hypothetical protein